MKTREQEWLAFAQEVKEHIRKYTIDQYGEKGSDYLTDKSAQFCIDQIGRYVQRFNKPHRKDEGMRDMKKIAHYACVAWCKLIESINR